MDHTRKNGATLGVCPPCADYFGAKGDERYDRVELQAATGS